MLPNLNPPLTLSPSLPPRSAETNAAWAPHFSWAFLPRLLLLNSLPSRAPSPFRFPRAPRTSSCRLIGANVLHWLPEIKEKTSRGGGEMKDFPNRTQPKWKMRSVRSKEDGNRRCIRPPRGILGIGVPSLPTPSVVLGIVTTTPESHRERSGRKRLPLIRNPGNTASKTVFFLSFLSHATNGGTSVEELKGFLARVR